MWCVAEIDETYQERMEDVLAVYERPLEQDEPVVCLDEKPVALHAEVREPIPAAPGRVARRDSEYKRCGTANVFCAVEPKAGRHFTAATPNRSGPEFAKFLAGVTRRYPSAKTIHLVMDNLNTHCRKSLTDFYGEEKGGQLWRRLTVHYTPKHGSWLNQGEIEISLFSRQCLGKRRIADLLTLRQEVTAWNHRANRKHVRIDWRFDRQAARKIFRYAPNQISRSRN